MKRLKILLVEDDKEHCNEYMDFIVEQGREHLLKIAHGCKDGFEVLRNFEPDVILLDLKFNNSDGSGIEFLLSLKSLELRVRPIVIVITNIVSKQTEKLVLQNGADFIFKKDKIDYSPKMVIDFASCFFNMENQNIEYNITNDETIKNSIAKTLEGMGFTNDMDGKEYLAEAILVASKTKSCVLSKEVYPKLARQYKKSDQSIEKAINNAIKRVWYRVDLNTIAKYYTAQVSFVSGYPSNKEFICYFADKFRTT